MLFINSTSITLPFKYVQFVLHPFDKKVVTPKETKYWGARIHQPLLVTKGFKGSYEMATGSITVRFIKQSEYLFLVNPMPIGVYMPRYSVVDIVYDDNGDVNHIYSPAFNTNGRTNYLSSDMILYVAKGNGEVIRTSEKDCRKLFEDDPEILKDYDSDNTFTNINTKRTLRVLKYVVRYNKKHTLWYKPNVMN
jgi:hypothetical protein